MPREFDQTAAMNRMSASMALVLLSGCAAATPDAAAIEPDSMAGSELRDRKAESSGATNRDETKKVGRADPGSVDVDEGVQTKEAPGSSPKGDAAEPRTGVASEVIEAGPGQKPTLLVMPLTSQRRLKEFAQGLDAIIITAVSESDAYSVLGPSDIDALLGVEALKDAVGCDDVQCAAEIGGALGAPYSISGVLRPLGKQVVLNLNLMDTQSLEVVARASQRSKRDADALARAATLATNKLLGLDNVEGSATAGANNYEEYVKMNTRLSGLMSRQEHTELLKAVEAYRGRSIDAPPGSSAEELLAFYRGTGCFFLKRSQCLEETVARYEKTWPQGAYLQSLTTYRDTLSDQAFTRDAKTEELRARLAEIDDQLKQGVLDRFSADQARAYAYFGALRYENAAALFERLMAQRVDDKDAYLEHASMAARSYESSAQFERARNVLVKAQKRYPTEFRLKSMHQQLKLLPK